jgi:hypothetical protein
VITILKNALRQIEKAFDSGLLISDEFEQVLYLEEIARAKEERSEVVPFEESADEAA